MPQKLHIHKLKKKHAHANTHKHRHEEARQAGEKAKDTPGIICLERNIHDGAVVISATLTLEYENEDLTVWISEELEKSARTIKSLDGIVGHIKAAVTTTSMDMISVTEESATQTAAPKKSARIALAAIVFMVEPEEAENIVRKALAGVRARLRGSAGEDSL